MADDGEILAAHINVSVDTTPSEKGAKKVEQDWKHAAGEVDTAAEKIEKALKKVKGEFGKRSAIGEIAETLKGAGALAGIAVVEEVLEKSTEKAAELTDQFRQGKISAAGLADGIAASIPLLSQARSIGLNIREMFTGERAANEEYNESIRLGNELWEYRKKLQEDSEAGTKKAGDALIAANRELKAQQAAPGIQRQLVQRQNAADAQVDKLREEIGPYAANKRIQDKHDELTEQANKELEKTGYSIDRRTGRLEGGGNSTEEQTAEAQKILTNYSQRAKLADAAVKEYNEKLALYNNATIKTIQQAAKMEEDAIASGSEEIYKIRAGAAAKLAETRSGKLENFREEKKHEGYTGAALDNLVAAKNEELQADALKGSRDELRDLNKEYDRSQVISFSDKVAENRKELEEQAREGKITADSIDSLSEAYAKLAHVEIEDKLKEAAQAVKEIGETDIDKQVDAFKKMGANAAEAAKYAADLKAAATGNDIKSINNQLDLVGRNPLEAARISANQKGEDGNAVGKATGVLLGAQLAQSLRTPFEDFKSTIAYYKQLLAQGDISQKTFQQAQLKAFDSLVAGVEKTDIDTAAKNRISNQFAGLGVAAGLQMGMPAVNNINNAQDAKKKADEEKKKHANNNKSLDKNNDLLGMVHKGLADVKDAFEKGIHAIAS